MNRRFRRAPMFGPVFALGLAVAACGSSSTSASSNVARPPDVSSSVPVAGDAAVGTGLRSGLGTVLVEGAGHTLYRFRADSAGVATCTAACATLWPPLLLASGQATPDRGAGRAGLGAVMVGSGRRQVTYQGGPLYRYAQVDDVADAYGQGLGGEWFAVVVSPPSPASTSPVPATTAHPEPDADNPGGANDGDGGL